MLGVEVLNEAEAAVIGVGGGFDDAEEVVSEETRSERTGVVREEGGVEAGDVAALVAAEVVAPVKVEVRPGSPLMLIARSMSDSPALASPSRGR